MADNKWFDTGSHNSSSGGYPSNYHPNSNEHKVVTQNDRGGFPGFAGIRHKGMNAAKQIQGYEGPDRKSDSSPEGRADNASFDRSGYQDLISSMRGLPLTKAPVGSEDGNSYTRQPSNQSGSQSVGAGGSDNPQAAHKPNDKRKRTGTTILREVSDGSSFGS